MREKLFVGNCQFMASKEETDDPSTRIRKEICRFHPTLLGGQGGQKINLRLAGFSLVNRQKLYSNFNEEISKWKKRG
jgi:hypothetical protein